MEDPIPRNKTDLSCPSPGITGAPLRSMHPAWVSAERISWWIFDAVVLIPAAIVAGMVAFRNAQIVLGTVLVASWILLTALMLWGTLAYPKAAYRHARIAVGDLGLEYRRGVWWRKTTIIPRSRVQHTDVSQGPVMRRFGLGKLVVHTAGTRNAIVEIQGLALDEAERIRDRLLDRTRPPSHDPHQDPRPDDAPAAHTVTPETDGV